MKQLGLIIIAGITLINLILSAGAQLPFETENCLEFSKISWNDITVSWKKTCFNNAASYRVEIIVPGVRDCNKNNVPCEEDLCQTSLQPLGCDSSASPCVNVTVNITDAGGVIEQSVSTNFAPYLKSTDLKLADVSKDLNGKLNAKWGPPEDSDYISCATRAVSVATCNDREVDRQLWVTEDILGAVGNTSLDVTNCTGEITLTVSYTSEVSYMNEDVLTETKTSKTLSDLSITKVSSDEVGISWTNSSFSNAESYKIEVNGACTIDDVSLCTEEVCETTVTSSDCNSIGPCNVVTLTVTGINVDRDPETISTILAPSILADNWNLKTSFKGTVLNVTWGPFSGDDASCATDTLVTAYCGSIEISEKNVNPTPNKASTQILSIEACEGEVVTSVTVISLSGISPTETKSSWTQGTTTNDDSLEGWEIALIVIGVVVFVVIVATLVCYFMKLLCFKN